MAIFTTDVIPWKEIMSGQKIDWNKFWDDAKAAPVQFGFEFFAVVMMLVGVYVVGEWAFELGRIVGRSF
jgi:hypothetical protein